MSVDGITCIYVMWSKARQLSKVGISQYPHARANQLRGQKRDHSITLMACWNIVDLGMLDRPEYFEVCIVHGALDRAGYSSKVCGFSGEWFDIRYPAAIALVEQCAMLMAPLGVRLLRMPRAHGD